MGNEFELSLAVALAMMTIYEIHRPTSSKFSRQSLIACHFLKWPKYTQPKVMLFWSLSYYSKNDQSIHNHKR